MSYHQHGFMKKKSCSTNQIETIDIVSQALNRGFCASIDFNDFLKEFEKVLNHRFRTFGNKFVKRAVTQKSKFLLQN